MKCIMMVILTFVLVSAPALSQSVPDRAIKMGTYIAKFESVKEQNKFLTIYFGIARNKKFALLRELKVNDIRYLSLTIGKYKFEDGALILKVKDLKEFKATMASKEARDSYSSCMEPAETSLWIKLGNKVEIEKKRDATILKGGELFAYLFGKKEVSFEPGPPEMAYLVTLDRIDDIDGEGLNLRPVCFKAGMKGVIE